LKFVPGGQEIRMLLVPDDWIASEGVV